MLQIHVWLHGNAYDGAAEDRLKKAGFEVIDPKGKLLEWKDCALVPLRVEGGSSSEQVCNASCTRSNDLVVWARLRLRQVRFEVSREV